MRQQFHPMCALVCVQLKSPGESLHIAVPSLRRNSPPPPPPAANASLPGLLRLPAKSPQLRETPALPLGHPPCPAACKLSPGSEQRPSYS